MNKIANTEVEINIFNLLKKLWKKKFLITFVAIAFATAGLFYSLFIVTPQYISSTRIYVINPNTPNNSITAQDLQAGSFLANDYKEIITSTDVLEKVISSEKLNYPSSQLLQKITVSILKDTRVISISVEDANPKMSQKLANSVREAAVSKIKAVTQVEDITTLEKGNLPKAPSSPNIKKNVLIGFIVGAGLSTIVLVIMGILDDRVNTEEDIEKALGLTSLGIVPDLNKL
ncbi:Wzz/FepE/Etk N-terminal domain-containing protein [Streptococcus agalactiae]|uniref:Capsular polysaccharide biosynthesis protein CpsC n=1 Tax=Streptococcus agalactiae TaxID=1311 RepID=A0A1N6LYI9_STRAG|nr:Wzz/FepE/Etk N-terminal domain-containing protein [Streptococcus agalactiae]EPW49522.1 capsular polysaccharide biosynthesis protein CpsC [Streptococcus agalactiae LMG 15081]KLK71593.1 capsular biosynthesis protein CpsC [Streptococcus agalactiae]SIO73974.1 Capsular polysaccharide biosynthesis protein CpsC [Streptococcus agalactiae]SUN15951.1 Tyrosine-protein kinase transmembrane modulator EpsC [Streptococcus agalactiae]SUN36944.1 Tyrosine-protein kinase transmembrane modulator EpsC [Streptoc